MVPYEAGAPSAGVAAILPADAGVVLDAGFTWSDTGIGELAVTTKGLLVVDPESSEMAGVAWQYFDPPSQLIDLNSYASLILHVEGDGLMTFGISRELAGNVWSIAYQMQAGHETELIDGVTVLGAGDQPDEIDLRVQDEHVDAAAVDAGPGPEADGTPGTPRPQTISIAAAVAAAAATTSTAEEGRSSTGLVRPSWRRRLWAGVGASAFVAMAAAGSVVFGRLGPGADRATTSDTVDTIDTTDTIGSWAEPAPTATTTVGAERGGALSGASTLRVEAPAVVGAEPPRSDPSGGSGPAGPSGSFGAGRLGPALP